MNGLMGMVMIIPGLEENELGTRRSSQEVMAVVVVDRETGQAGAGQRRERQLQRL